MRTRRVAQNQLRKYEEGTVAESTGTQAVADDASVETAETAAEHVSEYTTESTVDAETRQATRKPVVTGNALATGRRKEAIARVRIVPGSGQWRINDRTLDDFFPNKVHQQLISEPFVSLGADNQFDVVARITGGGVTGQAGALRLGVTRSLLLLTRVVRSGWLTPQSLGTEDGGTFHGPAFRD